MIFFSGYQLVFQQLQSQLRHLLRRHHHSASFCIVVSSRSGGKASPSPLHFGFPPRKKSKVMRYLRPRSRFTQQLLDGLRDRKGNLPPEPSMIYSVPSSLKTTALHSIMQSNRFGPFLLPEGSKEVELQQPSG